MVNGKKFYLIGVLNKEIAWENTTTNLMWISDTDKIFFANTHGDGRCLPIVSEAIEFVGKELKTRGCK